jgi:hypothetical protein
VREKAHIQLLICGDHACDATVVLNKRVRLEEGSWTPENGRCSLLYRQLSLFTVTANFYAQASPAITIGMS